MKCLAHAAAILAVILAGTLIPSLPARGEISEAEALEFTDFIREYMEDLITDELGEEIHAQIIIPDLEKRRRLEPCPGELEAELVKKDLNRLTNSVKLTCQGDDGPAWTASVPIRVRYTAPAVTLTAPVGKNQLITAGSIEVTQVDKRTLRGGHFTDPAQVVGAKSKRELRPGAVLLTSQVCLVCKDDVVDLEAGTGEVTIKVQGKALQDGSLNSMVRVTNLISGREVTGKVVGVGHVRIDVK